MTGVEITADEFDRYMCGDADRETASRVRESVDGIHDGLKDYRVIRPSSSCEHKARFAWRVAIVASAAVLSLVFSLAVNLTQYVTHRTANRHSISELERLTKTNRDQRDTSEAKRQRLLSALAEGDQQAEGLRRSVDRLSNDKEQLENALAYLERTAAEEEQEIFVSAVFPIDLSPSARETTGTVDVLVQNVTFACKITWQVGETKEIVTVASGTTKLKMPAGRPVTIFCEPCFTKNWLQPVGVGLEREGEEEQFFGSTIGKMVQPLWDGDRVTLHFEQPTPPWNGVMMRVRGEWVLVTLERPWADYELDKFTDATQSKLPNTALSWAREGTEGLARELAKTFVDHRDHGSHWGKLRGNWDTSLTVPASETEVIEPFREITEDELVGHLVPAFELLKKQQPPLGPSIAEELEAAREFLKSK